MTAELRVPMSGTMTWANVIRPPVPLVYLDLNTVIYFARTLRGDTNVPAGYGQLYEAALRAKAERRAMFPLGESHLWEITKIADPQQRCQLTEVLEKLSDFNYLLGRVEIAELEFDARIAEVMGEKPRLGRVSLLRPTFGQVFGMVGGTNIFRTDCSDGSDKSKKVHVGANDKHSALQALTNVEFERRILRGPTDEETVELRKDPNYRPEAAFASLQSRVDFELDTKRVLNLAPKWRRGRLRDLIGAREIVHEWSDVLSYRRADGASNGMPTLTPSADELRLLLSSMPHVQVAISLKTHMHKNPQHNWTANDISDIDAMSVAYAYCEAVFPDKAIRHALLSSKELRAMTTFVPRRPNELTKWLNALRTVAGPNRLVSHPLLRAGSPTVAAP